VWPSRVAIRAGAGLYFAFAGQRRRSNGDVTPETSRSAAAWTGPITLRGQCRCGRGFVAQSVSEPVPAGVLLWLAVGVVGGLRAEQALAVRGGAW
jgi:hypothetical protein